MLKVLPRALRCLIPLRPSTCFQNIMLTFEEMLVAFVIASVTGIGIGLSMGMWRKLDVALNPYVNALYVTPRIVLIPSDYNLVWCGIQRNHPHSFLDSCLSDSYKHRSWG
jgi:ABC-type nitrate/sulfonate/bicarbonate transport system permease component